MMRERRVRPQGIVECAGAITKALSASVVAGR
jgi:hypothetical protein